MKTKLFLVALLLATSTFAQSVQVGITNKGFSGGIGYFTKYSAMQLNVNFTTIKEEAFTPSGLPEETKSNIVTSISLPIAFGYTFNKLSIYGGGYISNEKLFGPCAIVQYKINRKIYFTSAYLHGNGTFLNTSIAWKIF